MTTQIINFNQSIPNPIQANINLNLFPNKNNNRFETIRRNNDINSNQNTSHFGLKMNEFPKETNQKARNNPKNKSAMEQKTSILYSKNDNAIEIEDQKNPEIKCTSGSLEKLKDDDKQGNEGTQLKSSIDQNTNESNSSKSITKNDKAKIKEKKDEKESKKPKSGKVQYNFFNFDSHMKKVNEHLNDSPNAAHKLICANEESSKLQYQKQGQHSLQNIINHKFEENKEEISLSNESSPEEKIGIMKSDPKLIISKISQLDIEKKQNNCSSLKEEPVLNISLSSSIVEGKNKVKYSSIIPQRFRQARSINLCHDSHANIINYFCESQKIAVCEYCLGEYKKEDKNFVDIKDYISKYQETLTNLISLSNHIIENLTFENQALASKEKLIASINNKFNDFIFSLESARELVISIIKKRFDNFDKNSQSYIAEISEDLIQKSNELRKAMISKKYLNMLNIIKIEDIKKKEAILFEMDESLKIFLEEQLNSINNKIMIPHFELEDSLKKLSIKYIMNEFPTSIPKSVEKNFNLICWNNGSKIYKHNISDKLFSFSTNNPINQDFLAEIRINRLSNSKIASFGISNIGFEINYAMFGYDFGPHQIAIFPNKIIGDRGKIINSELEYNEGDIIYISALHNEITFKVNCSKASFTCKSCKPPYFICCTLYNKNDEVEIINLKEL